MQYVKNIRICSCSYFLCTQKKEPYLSDQIAGLLSVNTCIVFILIEDIYRIKLSYSQCRGSESSSFSKAESGSASKPKFKSFGGSIWSHGGPCKLKMEPWMVCRPVAAEWHPLDKKEDPDLHQSEKSDPDPRQSVKRICPTVQCW